MIALRKSRFLSRESKLSILLSACRLWESRALIEKTRRVLRIGKRAAEATHRK